jgi:HlyD family secretion protein
VKKYVPWILAVLVVASAAGLYLRFGRSSAVQPTQYKSALISKKRIIGQVTASGTLLATVTVQVGTQVSGRIQSLGADFNSQVKKGELIAKIDPLLFQAAVQQASANYVSAQASLTRAKAQALDAERQFARSKALKEQGLASQQELDTAEANVSVMRASVDVAAASISQAGASLSQARTNLSYTDIRSPIDGTVISRNVDVGQTVASSLSAPVIFTIAEDLKKMQVHTNISEGDVGRLQAGLDAWFTVDAFPGQRFRGKIAQIRNAAQTLQNVVTYDAVIDVDNAELKLRPGMTANATVVYAEKDDALAIPNAALRFKAPAELIAAAEPVGSGSASASPSGTGRVRGAGGGGTGGGAGRGDGKGAPKRVYVLRNGVPVPVQVELGLSDGSYTEVLKGDIADGDQVVIDAVAPGAPSAPAGGGAPGGGGQSPLRRL